MSAALSVASHLIDYFPNAIDNIHICIILRFPLTYRLTILRKSLEFAEGRSFPVTRTNNYWDDSGINGLMAFNCPCQLDAHAKVRVNEISTNQQKDDPCAVKLLFDLPFPLASSCNVTVVPF